MPLRPHIVFAEPFDDAALQKARAAGCVTLLERCDEDTLRQAVIDADALVVRTAARVTRSVIEAGARLRVIGRGGVGLDNIDVEVAKEREVAVVYTPYAATDAVADIALGMIICLLRNLHGSDAAVRAGRFAQTRTAAEGRELGGLTLGIVGYGRIGSAVGQRCYHGFGMRVLYNDLVTPDLGGVPPESRTKERLYAESDIVSLHVPLTRETDGLIDDAALACFRPSAILINTARGRLIDSEAVAKALRDGRLAGGGFDVLDVEPPPPDHPLLKAPHTIITPHIGARTRGGLAGMSAVIDDVLRVLRGEKPEFAA